MTLKSFKCRRQEETSMPQADKKTPTFFTRGPFDPNGPDATTPYNKKKKAI